FFHSLVGSKRQIIYRDLYEIRSLLFACPYTYTIWTIFVAKLLRATPDWPDTVSLLLRPTRVRFDSILLKLF
ncbi:unnamed protein product, partial [Brassica rapa subsp. trilocularis]